MIPNEENEETRAPAIRGLFAALARALDCAVLIVDDHERIVFANRTAENRYRLPAAGSLIEAFGTTLAEGDLQAAMSALRDAPRKPGHDQPTRVRLSDPSGLERLLDLRVIRLGDAHGGPGMRVVLLDEARGDPDGRVRRERAIYRIVAQAADVGVIACDAEGRVTEFNWVMHAHHAAPEAGERIEGLAARLECLAPDGVTALTGADSPVLRGLRGDVMRQVRCAMRTEDGVLRQVAVSAQPLLDGNGARAGAVTVIRAVEEPTVVVETRPAAAGSAPRIDVATLVRELEETLRPPMIGRRGGVAVFAIALDRARFVEDSAGVLASDLLFTETEKRLAGVLRPGDALHRLGGECFVAIVRGIQGPDGAAALGARLRGALGEPVPIGGLQVRTTVSIGVGVADTRSRDADALLRLADDALARAKARGRDRVEVSMDTPARESEPPVKRGSSRPPPLRNVDLARLRVFYQPVVAAASSRFVGAETLVRYEAASGTILSPDEFMPAVADAGRTAELDAWMLDQACKQAAAWRKRLPQSSLAVSCNVAPSTLNRTDLDTSITDVLSRHDLPAGALALELTESALLSCEPTVTRNLNRLRASGFAIGIDEFGAGGASLAHLQQLPLSFLKLGATLVRDATSDERSGAVLSAVVRLARSFGMTVTAKGVEDAHLASALRDIGCDQLQGYYFARPVPPTDLDALLN